MKLIDTYADYEENKIIVWFKDGKKRFKKKVNFSPKLYNRLQSSQSPSSVISSKKVSFNPRRNPAPK